MGVTIRQGINRLYFLWAMLVFVLPTPLILLIHILARPFPEKQRLLGLHRVHRIWVRSWELLTGIHFRLQGQEHLDPDQAYVLICNHSNLLDIPSAGSLIQHPWKGLVKAEIRQVPLIGWIIRQLSIPVNRKDQASRRASLQAMVDELKGGISILIFPEGTRNRTDQPLKDFYPGAFKAAIEAQVPILPMVLTGTRSLQPVDSTLLYPGSGQMTILPPVPTTSYQVADATELMEQVRAIMETEIVRREPMFQPQRNSAHPIHKKP